MEIEIDPEKAGFAPGRLDRIDRHLARYVDDGLLTGWQVAVTRDGRLVHHGTYGPRDREAGLPVEPDTIWRIYSMTKPLTSVAAMMLSEEGLLPLRRPIGEILPEFADARVHTGGSALNSGTVPAIEPIRVWHLLSHTSGLRYGTADYLRFTRMLLGRGELDGVRLLGSRTVDFMTRNNLPGGADIATVAPSTGPTDTFEGVGFGLGFAVITDPVRNEILSSPGEYAWGGLASTAFWVDPVERITVVFMTQLVPSGTYPIRAELRTLVNSALAD